MKRRWYCKKDNILLKKRARIFTKNDTFNEIVQQRLERHTVCRDTEMLLWCYFVRATRRDHARNSWTVLGDCRRRWTNIRRNEAGRDFLLLFFFLGARARHRAVSDRVPSAIRGRPRGINDAGEIQFGVGGHKGVTERGGIYYHVYSTPPPSPPPLPPSAN